MKRLLILMPFLFFGGLCSAQLVNAGGTIVIESGAKLYVETDVTNNMGSTITNSGELEIQGHLTNNGTLTSTASSSTVKFSGTTNSNVNTNGALIYKLQMAKNSGTGTVTLTSPMNVSNNLDFEPATGSNVNQIILGGNDLTLTAQGTTITDASTKDYIVADAVGKVIKVTNTDSSFDFPIGDATSYTPVTANYTGSAYSTATVSANLVDGVHPNKPADGTDFITRYWNVDQTGITGYSAALTGTYASTGDVTGTGGKVMGATQPNMAMGNSVGDWTFTGSNNDALKVMATVSGSADLTGFNFFGKANLTAYLAGALPNSGVGPMSTSLNALLPLTTPYNVAPWNAPTVTASAIPATATDWILIEARDAVTPATVLSQTSAFLLSDGSIVNIDGSALVLKDAKVSSHIAIKHRNHLGIRTASPLNLASAVTADHDFTTGTAQAYSDGGISNANMNAVGSSFALWSGDINSDLKVQYNGGGINDRIGLLQIVGSTTNTTPFVGYSNGDVDLNGSAQYNGGGLNDRIKILQTVGSATNTTPILGHL